MRALSLWQPWASLCLLPHPRYEGRPVKQFETRSWPTAYRGRILIHAAKKMTTKQRQAFDWAWIYESLSPHYACIDEMPTGALLGSVEVVACHETEDVADHVDDWALAMGDYSFGRHAWELCNPVLFGEPIPYRGLQRLFHVPSEVIRGR